VLYRLGEFGSEDQPIGGKGQVALFHIEGRILGTDSGFVRHLNAPLQPLPIGPSRPFICLEPIFHGSPAMSLRRAALLRTQGSGLLLGDNLQPARMAEACRARYSEQDVHGTQVTTLRPASARSRLVTKGTCRVEPNGEAVALTARYPAPKDRTVPRVTTLAWQASRPGNG